MSTTSFKDHFSKVAAQYAAFRPQYPDALIDYVAGLCEQRKAAWDCACGSGQASIALAERFDSVIATDASEQQIKAAKPHAKVQYRVAPAESSGLEPLSMDLVTVAQALHWFNLDRFYAEVDRVLKPHGIFAVWTYGVLEMDDPAINERVLHLHHQTLGPYWPPERRIVESGYRSVPFPFEELQTPRFDLSVRWSLDQVLGYFRSWSSTNRYVAQHGVDPIEPFGVELAKLWGDPQSPRVARWPVALRVSRKPR